MFGRKSRGRHEPYFPDDSFSAENLERKLRGTFEPSDLEAAREELRRLDAMPISQTNDADGLRARCKFDALWFSHGDLSRLSEGVEFGLQDFSNLMGSR